MILKVVWRVLMGVLRVLEGCCRVFEVCLEGVWKNKIEVWNQSDPPLPLTKWFHKKSFFSRMMASLSLVLAHVGSDLLWNTPILPWTWIFPFPHFHPHWHVGLSMRWRSIFTRSKNIPLSLASIRAKPSCFGISLDWRLIPCDVTSQLNHAQLPPMGGWRPEQRREK